MAVTKYSDLIVWQKSMDLLQQVYRITRSNPKEELFGLTSQMRRAAVSIPSNIAEGQGRLTRGEFRQFLGNARGSLNELRTQVHACQRLSYFNEEQTSTLLNSADEVGRLVNGLLKSLD